jgi:type IV pilus assembly protein PilE
VGQHPDTTRGFTLVELMTAMAIAGTLAAIAFPSYHSFVVRSHLTEAMNSLSGYQVQMEQYYQDQGGYGLSPACGLPTPASTSYFAYTCTSASDGQTFTATATGIGMLAGYVYTVDDTSSRRTIQLAGSPVTLTCWATRPTDC